MSIDASINPIVTPDRPRLESPRAFWVNVGIALSAIAEKTTERRGYRTPPTAHAPSLQAAPYPTVVHNTPAPHPAFSSGSLCKRYPSQRLDLGLWVVSTGYWVVGTQYSVPKG